MGQIYIHQFRQICTVDCSRQTERLNKINPQSSQTKAKKLSYWREYCISDSCYDYCRFACVRNALHSLTHSLRFNYEKKVNEKC